MKSFHWGRGRPQFFYGWVIVIVVGLAGFTQSAGTFPVWGVLLKPMTEDFGWSRSVFTASTSIGTIAAGLISIGVGPLIDRFGTRWTLVLSLSILGFSLLLMAGVTQLWQFYGLQIVGRIMTMGVIALALSVVIPKWFIRKRGRAVAFSGLGMMGGGSLTPLYVQYLVNHWNWRVAVAVTGLVVWIVSLLPSAIFIRRQPEDLGLLPDGDKGSTGDENLCSGKGSEFQPEIAMSVREVVRLPSFYFLTMAFSLVFLVGPGFILHMVPYFTDKGISAGTSVSIVAVWAATGAIGALIFGFLAEKVNVRLVLSWNFLLGAVGFVFLLMVESGPMGFLWAIYMGTVGGAVLPLYQIIFADYYGRASLGAIRGIVWPVQMAANAMGPLSAAIAYDVMGNYFVIFAIFGVLNLVAGVCVWVAKPPHRKVLP